ncbi:unnamed protein product, partial [Tenebrio molitor]
VQVSSLGALRRHCRLDITEFGIWAKKYPVPRPKKLSGSPFRCRSCRLYTLEPQLVRKFRISGSRDLARLPKKKTSRQPRSFFLLSLPSASSRLPYSFFPSLRCSGEKECNLENPFTPPENSS